MHECFLYAHQLSACSVLRRYNGNSLSHFVSASASAELMLTSLEGRTSSFSNGDSFKRTKTNSIYPFSFERNLIRIECRRIYTGASESTLTDQRKKSIHVPQELTFDTLLHRASDWLIMISVIQIAVCQAWTTLDVIVEF